MLEAGQKRPEELFESAIQGPFGGIQSEVPASVIEQYGFADCLNLVLRQGKATTRGGLTSYVNARGVPFVGIADFVGASQSRTTFVNTVAGAAYFNSGTQSFQGLGKSDLPGSFQGGLSNLYDYAVLGGKIFFSQGIDPIHYWDGVAGVVTPVNMTLPAFFLMELDNRLIAGFTTESGNGLPQRVRYSNAGDGTDFTTAFATGAYDMFNSFGPISGLAKLGQFGYVFQNFGVTQIQPTGVGINPFAFFKVASRPKGTSYPYTIKAYGDEHLTYVGGDNVYNLDGSSITPIGDAPIDGTRYRTGARSRILTELKQVSNPNTVMAYMSSAINGTPFHAYWLFIPNFSTWVYNFEEGNWTRLQFSKQPTAVGTFFPGSTFRINDLQGTIAQQTWTPLTICTTNPFDSLGISFFDATFGAYDFTGTSDVGWVLDLGQKFFADLRHNKTWKKIRFVYEDIAQATFSFTLENDRGEIFQSKQITIGTGSGMLKQCIYPVSFTGIWVKMTLVGTSNAGPVSLVSIVPAYNEGGEITTPAVLS